MWKKHTKEVNYIEKFGTLTEDNLDKMLSGFSDLSSIEDKIDIIIYILDKSSFLNDNELEILRKYRSSNDDFRYHLSMSKLGNNFSTLISTDSRIKERLITSKKSKKIEYISIEGIHSQTIDKKIEICKSYLLFLKVGLASIDEEITNFFETDIEIVKINNAIADCVLRNNSFDCDEQILNKIKSIEREEKMDNFLKLF